MKTLVFTEKRLKDIPSPGPGVRLRIGDEECPGLIVRVTSGAKVFAFRSFGVEVTIGKSPTMTVEQARAHVHSRIAPNPAKAQSDRRARREALTVADAWDALLANPWRRDGKAALRPSTLTGYKAAWAQIQPHLGSRLLTEVDAGAVKALRAALLKKHGAAQTRQALVLLVVLLGGRMPRDAGGRVVGKPNVEPRRRFLDAAELGALLRGLDAEPPLWRVFWLCCLLAPLRRGNVAHARWTDLKLDHPARWMVSAADAKGGRMLAMPIAEPLAIILRDWKGKNAESEWVFPAGLTAGPRAGVGPIKSVQHAWARAVQLGEAVRLCDAIGPKEQKGGKERFAEFLAGVDQIRLASWRTARKREAMERDGTPLERAVVLLRGRAAELGIDAEALAIRDVVPHDLRRTAASWAVQAGASMAVVAASLGHADTRVTEQHYGHLSDDPVRRMLGDNAGRLLGTIKGGEPAGNEVEP